MSIKSWDRMADKNRRATQSLDNPPWVGFDVPVRVVPWPEGAPPPEDVPHAGERVVLADQERWRLGASPDQRKQRVWIVSNGIPYQRKDGNWHLRVHTEADQFSILNPLLSNITHPAPEVTVPEVTYTATEIRAAFTEEMCAYFFTMLADAKEGS